METFLQLFQAKSAWELLAVALGLAYLVLAMRQSLWCWPAAFISTAIYTGLFWHVSLLMDSALNVYYMAMAVYGFWAWRFARKNENSESETSLAITRWTVKTHALVITAVILVSLLSGYLLTKNTHAAWPYLDSFTTWGSVLTTYMVARKILENWLYWIVIDAVALMLYVERGLYFTAALFALYLVLCVIGYITWHRELKRNEQSPQHDKREQSNAIA